MPWRQLWRKHRDPYHIWVSEIMLQQTVIKAVIPVYLRFLDRFPTVADLAAAEEEEVRQAVRGLGYYRRFRFLHEAARAIVQRGGSWPETFDGWKELPGVGDYCAAAISSIAFGFPAAVVDGNVERVFCRLLDLREPPNESGLKAAFKILAAEFLDPMAAGDFNQALMELGQTVCTVTTPRCEACPLASGCLARERQSQALAPQPKAKPRPLDVAMRLVIVHDRGRVALCERPRDARFLKGTWGFLTELSQDGGTYLQDGGPGRSSIAGVRLGTVRHTITNHRIAALVEQRPRASVAEGRALRWVPFAEVEEALVSNLDRKAWRLFEKRATPLAL